jgi:2-isopropylmalate synthase
MLQLKLGLECVSDDKLARLTEVSRYVSELANLMPSSFQPYVGTNAFSHKAGLHASAMSKWEPSYQHIDPARVGNRTRVVVSELSGRQNIIKKADELGYKLSRDKDDVRNLVRQVKTLENRGFQYESAEASFELLVRRSQPDYQPFFELIDFMVVIERHRRSAVKPDPEEMLAEAMVKVKVGAEVMHTAAEGNGPVNALDRALRKALLEFYPQLTQVKLIDYKVRILEESEGTESQVRVLIASSDGEREWRTVGSSSNIIEASWYALADSLEYGLLKRKD